MKIQDLTSDLKGTAGDVAHTVTEALEHGRDFLGDTKDAGVSKASEAIDKGSDAIHTLTKLVGAYASIKTLRSAMDNLSPVERGLNALGLRRRPSTLSRVLTGIGLFAVGAAAGAGVALLLAPDTGEQTRRKLADRLQTLRGDAEGVARDVTEAARSAVQTVESTATNATNELGDAAQNLVGGPTYGASAGSAATPDDVTRRARASSAAHRAPRAPRTR